MQDIQYLKQAIENSESLAEGNFPAGAIVVLNDEVIALKSLLTLDFPCGLKSSYCSF